jgi:hypothetical protein
MLSLHLLFQTVLVLLSAVLHSGNKACHTPGYVACHHDCDSRGTPSLLQVSTMSRRSVPSGSRSQRVMPDLHQVVRGPTHVTKINVQVKGNISVPGRHRQQQRNIYLAHAGTSNLARSAMVTCQRGVSCGTRERASLIDGVTSRPFRARVPHAHIESCHTSKWVQVDLLELYSVSKSVLSFLIRIAIGIVVSNWSCQESARSGVTYTRSRDHTLWYPPVASELFSRPDLQGLFVGTAAGARSLAASNS